jgi:hypothetical protein
VDVTTIVTAAVAGTSAIAGGYLSMRQQLKTAREQLRSERDRDLQTRTDEKRDRRLESYRDLLNAERRLRAMVAAEQSLSQEGYAKWTSEFVELYNLVILTGTEPVRMLTDRLVVVLQHIDNERLSYADESFADSLLSAFQRYEEELEEARIKLIAAMRSDVASVSTQPPQLQSDVAAEPSPSPRDVASVRTRPPQLPSDVAAEPSPGPRRDVYRIALVAEDVPISADVLEQTVAALQQQVTRDFRPIWNVQAEFEIYTRSDAVPADRLLIQLVRGLEPAGTLSYHTDDGEQPVGYVLADKSLNESSDLSLALSHSCLEMIVNPDSTRFVSGPSPKQDQSNVYFFVEVCDPCSDPGNAYEIDGVLVSDFCTPGFYSAQKSADLLYDYTGAIKSPLYPLPGGYLDWFDPITRHYWRATHFGDKLNYTDLGEFENYVSAFKQVKRPNRIGFFGSTGIS